MSLGELEVLLIVSAIVVAIGQSLAGYSLGGCDVSAVVGFIGAYIGNWVRSILNMGPLLTVPAGDRRIDVVWAVIGSALLVFLLSFIQRRRARTYD